MESYCITQYGGDLSPMQSMLPVPKNQEILIKVVSCGVCHSDVHIWNGSFDLGRDKRLDLSKAHNLPFTLGHEIVGNVVGVGDQNLETLLGAQVVVYPWIGCGICAVCQSGDENLCGEPRNLGVNCNGGFSTHVMVPHRKYLFTIGEISPDLAATYACSGLTSYSALKKVGSKAGFNYLLIIGAGGVGLSAVMLAQKMMDSSIIVADIDPVKRKAAMKAGADYVIDPIDSEATRKLKKIINKGTLAAIDFVGSNETVRFGYNALSIGGKLIIVGLFGGSVELSIPIFPLKSVSIEGSYVGSLSEMGELMDLVSTVEIKPIPISTVPLSHATQTLKELDKGMIVGRRVLKPT